MSLPGPLPVDSPRIDPAPEEPGPVDPLPGLLAAAAAGDERAFDALYHRTRAPVGAVVRRVVRSPETTADVVQDVYAAAWLHAGRYDPERGAVLAWLATLARRKAVDRVRQVVRQAHRDQQDVDGDQPAAGADEVGDAVLRRWEAGRVRTALAQLPPAKREVLHLTYWDGCTALEVADRLQIPLGTVKTRRRDGLLVLRGLLDAPA